MKFKTVTLIVLIGISLHFVLSLAAFFLQDIFSWMATRQFIVAQVIFSSIVFNGSLILFLFVLYKKQRD